MSVAVIFNGQGAHYEEMGQDFINHFPEAMEIYEKAEKITGYPIRKQITNNFEALQETRYAQVAIAATSLAIYQSIEKQLPAIDYMAGLSLGEYSALIASGMLSFEEGFKILKNRGQLMTTHCKSLRSESDIAMAAVINMPLDKIKSVIEEVNESSEKLYLANLNSSTQVIIAGTKEGIKQFKKIARAAGYKRLMPLKVEGPFHSPYMEPICEPYKEMLEHVTFHEGEASVISNTTVQPHTVDEIKNLLVRHLTEPVRWEETIDYLVNQGVSKIIQIGPGKTLANLLKREPNAPETLVVDKVADVEKISDFVGG